MTSLKILNNKKKAEHYKNTFNNWKTTKLLNNSGFFIIFNEFESKNILKHINGNALKLYIFLGIHSNNTTGDSWYSIETICNYFGKSPRTISYWIDELEKANLIRRMQLEVNKTAHTYLQPY